MNELDFHKIEQMWSKIWQDEKIYFFKKDSKKPVFSIDTPPPTVSGRMHLGHAFSYSHTDFIARYKRMNGYNVFYPFGYDDNGLATERFVEKNKKIVAKDFSRKEFIRICLETTLEAEEIIRKDFQKIGLSCHDWETYRTIDDNSRATSQKSFIDIYRKGRAYRKKAPTIYCTKCETAIAQAELKDIEVESIFNDLAFELENGEKIVISTTRPEMLAACVAIFVNPQDEKNKRLIGKKAKVPLYNFWVPILADERADPNKGSGIVMCCTFGDQTDMEWYYAHNLPLKMIISKDGKMLEQAGLLSGMKIKEARKKMIEELKSKDLIIKQLPIKHNVNAHERCGEEIEIIENEQWFIKYLDLKEDFIARAKQVKWFPEHMKNRYDNWIKGLQWDWNISRQRYYGVPFPVWYCKKCGKEIIAEEKQLPVDPLQDKPLKPCICGSKEFEPEKDVLDTWATSSLTPQIALNWVKDKDFFKKMFPMSLRPQAHDIITLWAFNTIVKAHFHENSIPWKNIMISGWALDPKGKKMSKSLGNVIEPMDIIEKYSTDCLRFWAGMVTLGEDVPVMEKDFVRAKKFLTKYWNIASFVQQSTQGFDHRKFNEEKLKLHATDKWILSQANKVIKDSSESLESFEYSKALNSTTSFLWLEFADYYIEEVKYRLSGKQESKESAQYCLQKIFLSISKILAIFLPHITEETMQSKFKHFLETKSIHLEKWPKCEEQHISEEYSEKGRKANEIISEIRKSKTVNKKPLNHPITVLLEKEKMEELKEFLEDIKQTVKATEIVPSDKTQIKI